MLGKRTPNHIQHNPSENTSYETRLIIPIYMRHDTFRHITCTLSGKRVYAFWNNDNGWFLYVS